MKKITYRRIQIFLVFLTLSVLSISFYLQYAKGMQPCPLCLMQRFFVSLLFFLFLVGVYVRTLKRARLISIIQILTSMAGLFFAGRQLWLQSLPPDKIQACLPGIDILMRYFPWQDLFYAFLWGSGDCAEVTLRWWGFSLPEWALGYFLVTLLSSLFLLKTLKNERI